MQNLVIYKKIIRPTLYLHLRDVDLLIRMVNMFLLYSNPFGAAII